MYTVLYSTDNHPDIVETHHSGLFMHFSHFNSIALSLFFLGCSESKQEKLESTEKTNEEESNTNNNNTEEVEETSTDNQNEEGNEWGQIIEALPETFFSADLSENVQNGVTNALLKATEYWGNYGPLEYWVMGIDTDAAIELITLFCKRRTEREQWNEAQCMEHHSRPDGMHNFMSYLEVGQQAIENNQPMSSMGRNGNREWGIHLFTSSYPFGFDDIFDYASPEDEIKIIFHEYFHAVQHAHIQSTNYDERDMLLGPTWFVEGGAEYMATYATAKLWASGELPLTENSNFPPFEENMKWKMINGKDNIEENCPGISIDNISYDDDCSYAAYELGAWAIAFLHHQSEENRLLDTFFPILNELGWEGAFVEAFQMSSDEFYTAFNLFLEKGIDEQMAILPEI